MRTILVIEDIDAMRTLLRLSLEEAGYDVQEAANGAEGIRAFRKAPADLVITDIFMLGCDGLEVIQALRRVDPEVKILAVTGRSDTSDFLKVARTLGAKSVLHKPFERDVLLQTVAGLLSLSGVD
jgi:CheY-like chemotaxis protein